GPFYPVFRLQELSAAIRYATYLSAGMRYTTRKDHAATTPVAGRVWPGARPRIAHAMLLRQGQRPAALQGRLTTAPREASRKRGELGGVGGPPCKGLTRCWWLQKTRGLSESREIAQAVEDVALVPDQTGLVELGHRIVPALARPGCIIATHEAKHIPLKPGPGELGLHVAHDGRVLGQLSLCEVMRRWSAPRLRGCSIEMRL